MRHVIGAWHGIGTALALSFSLLLICVVTFEFVNLPHTQLLTQLVFINTPPPIFIIFLHLTFPFDWFKLFVFIILVH